MEDGREPRDGGRQGDEAEDIHRKEQNWSDLVSTGM